MLGDSFVRHIVGTIGTRVISAGVSVLLLLLHANYLGDDGLGVIALIVLAVTLASMAAYVIGGGVLVYFTPRATVPKLLLPAYLWGIGSLIVVIVFLYALGLIPAGYEGAVSLIAVLEVLAYNHHCILVGKERITISNLFFLVRMLLLGTGVAIGILLFNILSPWVYVYAILLANTAWAMLGIWALRKEISSPEDWVWDQVLISKMFKLGMFSQGGNVLQILNYRLDIYLLEAFFPIKSLSLIGQYSAANQVSESLWIIPRAVASVQYSRIANSKNQTASRRLSLRLMGLCMLIAAAGLAVLLLIPAEGYVWLLGERFRDTGKILLYLGPGVLFLAGGIPLSPYFSGRGKHVINTWAAAIGLVATLGLGLWLIPDMGIMGAAITTSVSYGLGWLFQLVVMIWEKKDD
jgi:O-antigen/teichoic acid export membrane protein